MKSLAIRWSFFFLALVLAGPALAGDFDCADPGDLDPGETDLVVTKEGNVNEIEPGGEVIYTIRVHNCGPEVGVAAGFFDRLPDGTIVFSIEQTAGVPFELELPTIGKILRGDSATTWAGSINSFPVGDTAVFEVVTRHTFR